MMHILLLIVMVLSLATGGVVYAADSAVPGDPLYTIDRGVEDLRLSLTQDPEKRVALKLAFAEERLLEAQQLIEAERDTYTIALDSYRETMAAVTQAIETADIATQSQLIDQAETAVVVHETIVANWANQNADAGLVKANSAMQSVRNASFSQTVTPTLPLTATLPVTATLPLGCTAANPHPVGSSLAQQYGVEYEEIISWFCLGFGFGEIRQAYSLSQATGVDVADIFVMKDEGLGWGEIRQELSGHSGPVRPALSLNDDCTGANPHPVGSRLAQHYDVAYEEIMDWFCQGFGFGEIDQAYSLSQATGVDVADIFAMKDEGRGWGEIRQDLQGHPGRGPNKGLGGPPKGAGPPAWAGPPAGAGPPGGVGPGNNPGRGGRQ